MGRKENNIIIERKDFDQAASARVPKPYSIVVLFADLCGSTKYRTEEGHDKGYKRGRLHNFVVRKVIEKYDGKVLKEIGDEVMATFRKPENSVKCALKIIRTFDLINSSRTEDEKIFTKIGMSYGEVSAYHENDILGLSVDLAARIVSRAEKGQILMSSNLKQQVKNIMPDFKFSDDIQAEFRNMGLYSISELEYAEKDSIPKRQFGYYRSRTELQQFHKIEKDLESMESGSEVWIVGRSLVQWARAKREISEAIRTKNLKFKVLFLDPKANIMELSQKEQLELEEDLKHSLRAFNDLRKENELNFSFKLTSNVIWDTLEIFTKNDHQEVILFDICTGKGIDEKIGLEVKKGPYEEDTFHSSLHERAKNFYSQGKQYFDEGVIAQEIEKRKALETFTSEQLRGNSLGGFFEHIPKIFAAIVKNQEVPPPISVEFEITNKCNNHCAMCQRGNWKIGNKKELSVDNTKLILNSLSNFGVKNIVFSGGEPTLKDGFIDIIRYAKKLGMHLGILSNGCSITDEMARNISVSADWIRISLEGSNPEIDGKVRTAGDFAKSLASIEMLAKHSKSTGCKVGICYTMVKQNVSDFEDMVNFCDNKKEIEFASMKFAHGNNGFLCNEVSIRNVETIIKKRNLGQNRRMNLSYLSWFINTLDPSCISSGRPLRNFYKRTQTRCFTPYLSSLIDAFGDVYPCCHLYYDNSDYEKYNDKRNLARIGNLEESNFNFEKVWKLPKYNTTRSHLTTIDINEKNMQCSDCTRHFFHNHILTELFNFYSDLCLTSQEAFDEYLLHQGNHSPVWF